MLSDHESDEPDLCGDSSNDADERLPLAGSEYHDTEGDFILNVAAAHQTRDSRRTAFDGKRRTRVGSADRDLLKTTDNVKEQESMLESAELRLQKYEEFCSAHLKGFQDIISGIDRQTGEADPSLNQIIAKYQSKLKAPRFSDTVPQSVASLMQSGYFDPGGQNAEQIAHAVEVAKSLPWQDRKFLKKKNHNGRGRNNNKSSNNNNNNNNTTAAPAHESDSGNNSNNDLIDNNDKNYHKKRIRTSRGSKRNINDNTNSMGREKRRNSSCRQSANTNNVKRRDVDEEIDLQFPAPA
eukprot:TRINITY_DN10515_c0_g1_i1.p1 TRINITY_DN10515_c0_g1~~TRINITY_DN10515_c0_g1_i1.p1  ORF type:complete len:295 (+),score=67.05 TRINITY_DN10515_c0_g1_i1:123-1007(+)